ncbi:MAG: cyclic nucleotide-binding domain-containing protein [Acidimicrobiales bacterium]|jgi:CRP-like cAMP-binding protein|nr:cyclic nucleotide-binding domain-containing protein [Acidimicrobiales bacterium]
MSDKAILAQLKNVPLFSQTTARQRKNIARIGKTVTWSAGSTPIEQGSEAVAFFLILDGRVEVVRDGTTVAQLGPGHFVGEIALLTGDLRTADANALSDSTVFALGRSAFSRAIKADPAMALVLLSALDERQAAFS